MPALVPALRSFSTPDNLLLFGGAKVKKLILIGKIKESFFLLFRNINPPF